MWELNPSIRSELEAVEAKIEGITGVHVMRNGQYLGAVGLEDTVAPTLRTAATCASGARRIAIFTGDRLSVATCVGQAVGVDSI